jgi:uracil-DNA glycosylase family 4
MANDEALDELAQGIRRCPDCDLSQTRTQAVPGDGSASAQIMFIGEGPGYYEDKSGHPFVGPAGKFLDELLASIGLRREDVFITNVVKCRPPNNRDPLRDEMDACHKWLEQQIEIIDPRVVVTLGRFSMTKFFSNESISRIHGQPRKVGKRTIVPMLHPAAALHQERYRSLIVDDFKKLPEVLEAVEREQASSGETETQPTEQGRLF